MLVVATSSPGASYSSINCKSELTIREASPMSLLVHPRPGDEIALIQKQDTGTLFGSHEKCAKIGGRLTEIRGNQRIKTDLHQR